jgi:hypothetical protein
MAAIGYGGTGEQITPNIFIPKNSIYGYSTEVEQIKIMDVTVGVQGVCMYVKGWFKPIFRLFPT